MMYYLYFVNNFGIYQEEMKTKNKKDIVKVLENEMIGLDPDTKRKLVILAKEN